MVDSYEYCFYNDDEDATNGGHCFLPEVRFPWSLEYLFFFYFFSHRCNGKEVLSQNARLIGDKNLCGGY